MRLADPCLKHPRDTLKESGMADDVDGFGPKSAIVT